MTPHPFYEESGRSQDVYYQDRAWATKGHGKMAGSGSPPVVPSSPIWSCDSPKQATGAASFTCRSCSSGTRGSFSSPWERSSWEAGSSAHRKGEDTHFDLEGRGTCHSSDKATAVTGPLREAWGAVGVGQLSGPEVRGPEVKSPC